MTYKTEDMTWVRFYPEFRAGFYVEKAGYFDERPQVNTSITQIIALIMLPFAVAQSPWFLLTIPLLLFGYGKIYIHLPIKTGIQDCDSAAWGINFHDNKIWIYIGGAGNFEGGRKWKAITLPWHMTWVRTSTLMKRGYDWFHETESNRVDWSKDKDTVGSRDWLNENKWTGTHEYLDKYDNTIVNATIGVEEREWRPLWFKWTGLFAKTHRTIAVEFDKEVGERKGSWKGGTIGCSYRIKTGETPHECLVRMQNEREF